MKKLLTSIVIFLASLNVYSQCINSPKGILQTALEAAKEMDYRIINKDDFLSNYYDEDNSRMSCAHFISHPDTADRLNNQAVFFALSPKIFYSKLPLWTLPYFDSSLTYQMKNYNVFYNKAIMYAIEDKKQLSLEHFVKAKEGLNLYFSSVLHLNRGILYYSMKEYHDAIVDFNMAAYLGRNDYELYHNRGLAYYRLQEYDKAIKDFKEALKIDKNQAETALALGNALMNNNKPYLACKYYCKAWKLEKNNIKYALSYARVLLNLKEYKKSLNVFDYSLRTNRRNLALLTGKADALNGLQKYEEALSVLNKAIKISPENFDVMMRIADTYFLNHKYQIAIDWYNQVYVLFNYKAKLFKNIGLSYYYLNNMEEALKYYTVLYDSTDINVLNNEDIINFANAAISENKLNIACINYTLVLQNDSTNYDALNGLGIINLRQNEIKTAMRFFQKAIDVDCKKAAAFSNMALCHHYLLNYDESIAYFKKAYNIDKSDVNILNGLAIGYLCVNENEKAAKYMELAMALDHQNPYLLSNMSSVNSNLFLDNIADTNKANYYYNAALENINNAIKCNEGDALLHNNKGVILMNKCHYREALNKYFIPFNNYAHDNNAGICLALLEQTDSAYSFFELAIKKTLNLHKVPKLNKSILAKLSSYENTKTNKKDYGYKELKKYYLPENQSDVFTRIYYYYLPDVYNDAKKTMFNYQYPYIEAEQSKYVLEFIYTLPDSDK